MFFISGVSLIYINGNKCLRDGNFFRNELISMLYLDRTYTKTFFCLPKGIFWREKATTIWKSIKVVERSQRRYIRIWRNDNWIETKRSNQEI